MGSSAILFGAAFGVLLCALLVRGERRARLGFALAASLGGAYGWNAFGALGAALPALAATVALAQALGAAVADRGAALSADEAALRDGPLAGLSPGQLRRFLDQGVWLNGTAGDVLTREGESTAHLYWLASGEAAVSVDGRTVATCGPGQLVGEATVLTDGSATATVVLTRASRFWAAPAPALNAFLAANPPIAAALEHGFNLSLRDKLVAMNRAR
ncbi:cyclic nucleotide-binding domain-containing protein [Sphingomonas sp. ASV193]|uniref:cyclic nucleotide-binding domain-containing protein n=1 Tax=Sphingomonas sp. ASV193 TaxID=3144405 RepID=UPI0032E85AA6